MSLCSALRALAETRLFIDLGYPSIAAYADRFFHLRRAETFEYVRVAHALTELTELRDAFGRGELGWSVLKAVTRVASEGSQASWIEFARKHGTERALAEARDALRSRRDAPRKSSFGLPNLDQKLVLRFSRSDMQKVRAWIDGVCRQVAEKTGADGISLEQAVLFLCEREMATPEATADVDGDDDDDDDGNADADERGTAGSAPEAAGGPGTASGTALATGRRPRPDAGSSAGSGATTSARRGFARAQIVYHRCPDCRRSRMSGPEGFIEVTDEEVRRHAGCAESVVIDGPTPPGLRRRILGREGHRCRNPRCGNLAVHCHHHELRSEGGETSLANEFGLCATCHALIHAGLLVVTGKPDGELCFLPAEGGDIQQAGVAADRGAAADLPVVHVHGHAPGAASRSDAGRAGRGPSGHSGGSAESAIADSVSQGNRPGTHPSGVNLEDLAQGLVRLGLSVRRAGEAIGAAVAALAGTDLTEAGILRQALASF